MDAVSVRSLTIKTAEVIGNISNNTHRETETHREKQRELENNPHRQTDRHTADLYRLERVAHHGDEHVDENDDRGDVIEREQKHADRFHDAGGVPSTWKYLHVATLMLLTRVLDLDTVHSNQNDHYWPLSTPTSPNIDQNRLYSVRDSLPIKRHHVTIRYDTVDWRALKSWRDGQLNLAQGPERKNKKN